MRTLVILNIIILLFIITIILIVIYFQTIRDKLKHQKYQATLYDLTPMVLKTIENRFYLPELQSLLNNDFKRFVAIDILIDYSEKEDVDLSKLFIQLKMDTPLIKKLYKRTNMKHLKKLVLMRVNSAYDILLKLAGSENLDISYLSYFGLALMELPVDKKEEVMKRLIHSSIVSDRIVEILSKFKMVFEKWMELLLNETTSTGKIIYMKNIMTKEEIKQENYTDCFLNFLKDDREVKIAAIKIISNSENEKYLKDLIHVYENEEDWQVRMSVTKGLSNFKFTLVKDSLIKMTSDAEWWVRYNAIKSIVAMGEEGIYTLIDLTLDVNNKSISDLAYYFLNSNKDVYNIVKGTKAKKNESAHSTY
ncbi:MAG: hypothetical protein K0S41_1622 [Anaerocolumna sp.]|nr:hypothetical protein [Anaerocolumna sp.]